MSKSKLLSKNRRVHKTLSVEADGEQVAVLICKPTMGDRARVLEAARVAGEIDEKGEPTSSAKGLTLAARVVAAVLYDPETKQPIFAPTEIADLLEAPWLDDVMQECQSVFAPDVEAAKGK